MASTSQAAKRSRALAEQLSSMMDFLTEYPALATGKFQMLPGQLENDRKWAEWAAKLNSIGGAVKSVDQWHTVWRDLKSRTSVKARDRKRQQALTGNRPLDQAPMAELERRVIGLIGSSFVEGNDVPENIPTEEDFQLALEDGDETVFKLFIQEQDEVRCETPKTSTPKTPRRYSKKKRVEEDIDLRRKFLEIAEKQADGLKMLAECSSANTRLANSMTAATNALSGAWG
ncbi:PREDICTED: uncharacterized protein LOC108368600, partial [Rhagoletis zephyria]|uniref:uncharacterized protein LOC108368600 n=1 Tax=Rhagoletis zephyria TaxID=28612 RepID=UPI0008119882